MNTSPVRGRPEKTEYFEYYDRYVTLVPDGDIVTILREQLETALGLFRSIPKETVEYRYAPDKWTVKEVLGHLVDTEWVFTYRALSFARGQTSPLPGVDQDDLVTRADFASVAMPDLIEQFRHLRTANALLFDTFDDHALNRTGSASGYPFTVRSFPYIIAGHTNHHLTVLQERYLGPRNP